MLRTSQTKVVLENRMRSSTYDDTSLAALDLHQGKNGEWGGSEFPNAGGLYDSGSSSMTNIIPVEQCVWGIKLTRTLRAVFMHGPVAD